MNFAESVKSQSNLKLTENGATAYSTTNSALLDLFGQIGSLRPRAEYEIESKFEKAFNENPLLATKMLFYAGNIRGGLGERRTFKTCLRWLAYNHPDIVKKNIAWIPTFNRWDSLFVLIDTPVEEEMWSLIVETLNQDMERAAEKKPISLLGKWLPSENASSIKSKIMATRFIKALELTPRQYRKLCSALRKYLKVVEVAMSAGKWDDIDYPSVPSYAMKNYRHVFSKHDTLRFDEYKTALSQGKTKINASTLFPYNLVESYGLNPKPYDTILEEQWKALPNYVKGENNFIIMADVSGSMLGRPMATSIGLATYFAQRNKGAYHNLYMTFTDKPKFINLGECASLRGCINKIRLTDMGYSTNLEAAFAKILSHALENNISNEDLPKALIVISDMEIDRSCYGNRQPLLKRVKLAFAKHGYTCPKLVLWNVEARNDTFLSNSPEEIYVSGQSTSVFQNLCNALEGKTAYDAMLETLNDPMYDIIKI